MTEDADSWSAELRKAWIVAAYTRRFALIADRMEFSVESADSRAGAAFDPDGPLHLFDAAQMIGSSDLDRLCGEAVYNLRRHWRNPSPQLLDTLAVLGSDRVAAIYFALPPDRRGRIRRDILWDVSVTQVERWMPEAEARLNELIESTPTSTVGIALAQVDLAAAGDS